METMHAVKSDRVRALENNVRAAKYRLDTAHRYLAFELARERDGRVTKWDVLTVEERDALTRQHCGLRCSGCNTWLETEADFARHFTITDAALFNLGNCPDR